LHGKLSLKDTALAEFDKVTNAVQLIHLYLRLPLTFIVFRGLQNAKRFDAAMAWLAVASLAFYGWWSLNGLLLLLILMAWNYVLVAASLRRAS
jgi:hypothetical protein